MERTEAITKARKMYALAERGVEGERENARILLAAFMGRHNLSPDDVWARPVGPKPIDPVDVFNDYVKTRGQAADNWPPAANMSAEDFVKGRYPNPGWSEIYVRSAVRAYGVTSAFLGRDTTKEDVLAFILDAVRVGNTLFP